MADTERTKTELLAIFADGQPDGSITPQDMRDYVVTADIVNTRFSTGLITGGIITINAGDNTKVDISAGEGIFADNFTDPLNPVRLKVSWSDFIAEDVPDLVANPTTFFGLDLSSGTAVVVRMPEVFTAENRRDFIGLAPVLHAGVISIDSIGARYAYALDEGQTTHDLGIAIGSINLDNGNVFSANAGANLTIDKTAGSTFFIGDNYQNSQKDPNATTDPAETPVAFFFYTFQDGVGGFTNGPFVANVDPELFDNGSGTLAAVQANKFTTQRIWFFPVLNLTVIHYGQTEFNTLIDAQNAINTEAFNKNPSLISGFRTWLIVKKGTIDLTNVANTLFVSAGKFGDVLRE